LQRFLQELAGQFEADETAPPFLYINSRQVSVDGPEAISKALTSAFTTEKIQRLENYLGLSRFLSLLSSLKIKIKWSASLPFSKSGFEAELAKDLEKDATNFELTINKYKAILEALKPMPRKPVIVIGTSRTVDFVFPAF
jgi:hypothetical protein